MSLESIGEYSSSIGSTEQQSGLGEGKDKVNDADIARVREGQQKAKQIWGQISQSKKNNNAVALFLAFLMQKLSDSLLTQIYSIFFTKANINTGSKELKNNIYGIVLISIFIPFYMDKAKELGLDEAFGRFEIKDFSDHVGYIDYLSRVWSYYKIVWDSDEDIYSLLYNIALFYNIYDTTPEDNKTTFMTYLQNTFKDINISKDHTHLHTHHRQNTV